MQLLVVLCCAVATMAEPMSYRVPVDFKDISLKEDVMLDEEKRYAVVTIEDANLNPGHQNSINMHDFDTGYSVVKDVEAGKCYIIHSRHTLPEIKFAIEDLVQGNGKQEMKEYLWTCPDETSSYDEIAFKAGTKIANFCRDYESRFVTRRLESVLSRLQSVVRRKRSIGRPTYWCIGCSGSCR